MKKIIGISIILLLIFVIYKLNQNKEIYYFNIADNNCEYYELVKKGIPKLKKVITYEKKDMRINDLIRNIKNNIKINNKHIQNILVKADIITIDIGNNELLYQIKKDQVSDLYDYLDNSLKRIEKLLKLIRIYSKEKIYLIGFHVDDEYYSELIDYLNIRIEDICRKNNVIFIERKNIDDSVNISKKIIKSYCKK